MTNSTLSKIMKNIQFKSYHMMHCSCDEVSIINNVFVMILSVYIWPHRWHNGLRAHLECSRWWVRTRVGSNQRLYKIVASPLSTQHLGEREMTGWLGIRIMCPSGATCLPADCCFSELALLKSNSACLSRTKRTSSSSHWKLTCSRHDIAEKLLNWCLTTITHSLCVYLFSRGS